MTDRKPPPAIWSPARMNVASFKLFGFLLLRGRKGAGHRDTSFILNMTPQQNTAEAFTLALLYYIHFWMFVQALLMVTLRLEGTTALVVFLVAALPLLILTQLYVVGVSLLCDLIRKAARIRISAARLNAFGYWSILTIAALVSVRSESWVRWFGWSWLTLLMINAICAMIVWLIRNQIQLLEEQFR